MYIPYTSPESLLAKLKAEQPEAKRWLLLFASTHAEDIVTLLEALTTSNIEVYGGLFPGLIDGCTRKDSGVVAFPLSDSTTVSFAHLSPGLVDWKKPLPLENKHEIKSAFILVDSQSPNISLFMQELYDAFSTSVNYVGAGAGYPDLSKKPSIFSNHGFHPNTALSILSKSPARVNAKHGWSRVAGPFIATRTEGGLIQEINWEPAGTFYRKEVSNLDPELSTKPVFPDINQRFPLAIGKMSAEDVVRDPTDITAKNEIVVQAEVQENAAIYISEGDKHSLIESAEQAAQACVGGKPNTYCFISDCFSRALMLEKDLEQELSAVNTALGESVKRLQSGVLPLGEICGTRHSSLEFYNKTCVISLFDNL